MSILNAQVTQLPGPAVAARSLNLQDVTQIDEHLWATGDGGVVFGSSDGGRSWFEQEALPVDFRAVSFSDARRGVLAGRGGTIMFTADGGLSWESSATDTSRNIYGVSMTPDGTSGWAVGDAGTILVTGDAGRTWKSTSGPRGIHLSRCAAMSPEEVVIVGMRGTILTTADGGSTWTKRVSPAHEDLRGLSINPGGAGWSVGRHGTAIVTQDGGHTWMQKGPDTETDLYGVWVSPNGEQVWVCGDDGVAFYSPDSGDTWITVQTATDRDLIAVAANAAGTQCVFAGDDSHLLSVSAEGPRTVLMGIHSDLTAICASGRDLWVVGTDGCLLGSRDLGGNWNRIPIGTSATLWTVGAISDGVVLAGGQGGTIIRSLDAGLSWVQSKVEMDCVYGMSLQPWGKPSWAVGTRGTVLRSDDVGASWRPVGTPVVADLYAVLYSMQSHELWVVGDSGTLLYSADAGETWVYECDVSAGPYVDVHSDGQLARATSVNGFVATTAGNGIWRRENIGTSLLRGITSFEDKWWLISDDVGLMSFDPKNNTWISEPAVPRGEYLAISVSDSGLQLIGAGGFIADTAITEGWNQRISAVGQNLYGSCLHQGNAWVVGDRGTVLKRTTDGRWRRIEVGTGSNLYSIKFSDSGSAWIVGRGGVIVHWDAVTGKWRHLASGLKTDLLGVAVSPDGKTVVAAGDRGVILYSFDGGETWTQSPNLRDDVVYWGIAMGPNKKGWAVGDAGAIIRTVDGGATWDQQESPTTEDLMAVRVFSESSALIVGDAGTVLITHDSGTHWIQTDRGTVSNLCGVDIDAEGGSVVAVGRDDVVVFRGNLNAPWQSTSTGFGQALWSVERHGEWTLVVGDDGLVAERVISDGEWVRKPHGATKESGLDQPRAITQLLTY